MLNRVEHEFFFIFSGQMQETISPNCTSNMYSAVTVIYILCCFDVLIQMTPQTVQTQALHTKLLHINKP